MTRDSAEVRGRATVRPYRVGQVIDTTSAEEVRDAIANLSIAWGGYFTPVFDVNTPFDHLEMQARIFDVDTLHADREGSEVVDRLSRERWLWGGRHPYGPFSEPEEGFRPGVLQARSVGLAQRPLLLPSWDEGDPLDLFYTAVFGAQPPRERSTSRDADLAWEPEESARVGLGYVYVRPDATLEDVGIIHTTKVGVSTKVRHYLDWLNGIFVVRPDQPEDVVAFWNLRSYGRPIVPVPADGPEQLLAFLTKGSLPGNEWRAGGPKPIVTRRLHVWGLDHAGAATRSAIDRMAERLDLTVAGEYPAPDNRLVFPGLETRFSSSIRATFPSNAQSVTVNVPSVPLGAGTHQVMPGRVAVEVELHDTPGLDPRFAQSLPPLRRFGPLLERAAMHRLDHIRVPLEGHAVVLGVQAATDEVLIGFAHHLDAIRTLFDDDTLKVTQSDDGRFQTRAAQMLGGPFGGVIVQPGVRALIDKAGRSNAGLTLQQLITEVKRYRGAWPDKLDAFHMSPDDYARRIVNELLLSGLFVPMLDVHCSNCRVESQVAPRDLDATIRCEFCGEDFRLALSLALSRSKSRWRFRLAAHLSSEKVKALLPALATMSVLGQMTAGRGGGPHAFGVEFKFDDSKRIEADVVAYLADHDWTLALGEVKNSNWIDANDVDNLEDLQRRLDARKVRSILTFATLKDAFAPEEVVVLRGLVERGQSVTTAHGARAPRVPFVLTAQDLSLPWTDEHHPRRWTAPGGGHGIFETAVESCKRNLGLTQLDIVQTEGTEKFVCTWEPEPATQAPN